jgi:hypothetical protein
MPGHVIQAPTAQPYSVPTEFVDLPSEGKFYPEQHPLHGQTSVEIKFMTTKEEDILNSKSLLQENEAVNRMIESIIVNNSITVGDLLPTDRNAVMVAARKSGYGADYTTSVMCFSCSHEFDHTYDLNEIQDVVKGEEVEGVFIKDGLLHMALPKSGLQVTVRNLLVRDERDLNNAERIREKNNLPSTGISDLLKTMVVSINGNQDSGYISGIVDQMPAMDARFVRESYDRCTPTLDLDASIECPSCGATQRRMMPFTADFFWPQR